MRFVPAGSCSRFAVLVVAVLLFAAPASAQPFDGYLISTPGFPTTHGYVQIPNNGALDPPFALTIEGWVLSNLDDGASPDCRSIVGKGFEDAWWVGICNVGGMRTLRSYVRGGSSLFNGGRILEGQWTHFAVTFDGATRNHYINGELVASQALAGNPTSSSAPVRIGSDVDHPFSPNALIDEVRLWSVERTQAQIREKLNVRVTTPMTGLIAVWPLSGNGNDLIGPHHGALMGNGVNFLIAAVASDCGNQTETALCLNDKFQVTAHYRVGPQTNPEGVAKTIPCDGPVCESSGIFWFFQNINWELMVKVLNACAINNRWWVFNAGLTNQYFRLEVTDVTDGETKIYFNYPGPPAPAITDIQAFATCP
jgi:hypothetical protein